jgi:A/G-specific adenine glycosylase
MTSSPPCLADPLLAWYRQNRRDLPWRHNRDPYRIWVSELMLQQTRVDTVLRYYERFLRQFPDVQTLASASEEAVRAAWSGLGFYRRARNLHQGAKTLVREHGGQFPNTAEAVRALPGVGRYTTGAILSHAFDARLPIVDGNVTRVLARLFRLHGDPRSSRVQKRLWALAEAVLPDRDCGDFNQALMDLGATICTPKNPSCRLCPLQAHCQAFARGQIHRFPGATAKAQVQHQRRVALALVRADGRILLIQRPPKGLLAELWELPSAELADGEDEGELVRSLAQRCRASTAAPPLRLGTAEHRFSHRHWSTAVYRAPAHDRSRAPDHQLPARWLHPEDVGSLGLPTATRKTLAVAGWPPDPIA